MSSFSLPLYLSPCVSSSLPPFTCLPASLPATLPPLALSSTLHTPIPLSFPSPLSVSLSLSILSVSHSLSLPFSPSLRLLSPSPSPCLFLTSSSHSLPVSSSLPISSSLHPPPLCFSPPHPPSPPSIWEIHLSAAFITRALCLVSNSPSWDYREFREYWSWSGPGVYILPNLSHSLSTSLLVSLPLSLPSPASLPLCQPPSLLWLSLPLSILLYHSPFHPPYLFLSPSPFSQCLTPCLFLSPPLSVSSLPPPLSLSLPHLLPFSPCLFLSPYLFLSPPPPSVSPPHPPSPPSIWEIHLSAAFITRAPCLVSNSPSWDYREFREYWSWSGPGVYILPNVVSVHVGGVRPQ